MYNKLSEIKDAALPALMAVLILAAGVGTGIGLIFLSQIIPLWLFIAICVLIVFIIVFIAYLTY